MNMSTPIGERAIKRTNKDLGRVLAMARLSDEELRGWPKLWMAALVEKFPDQLGQLVPRAGAGLRMLLASEGF